MIGIHAREWISPATNIYIAHALLSNYSKDATITQLVDQFDFYILPVFNVDGYDYTWTKGKIKNRRRISLNILYQIVYGVRLEARQSFLSVLVLILIATGIMNGITVLFD